MRSKLIITGAIGVLAVATLTVNAQNASSKTTTGSVGTLLAASAQVVKADRDEVAIDTRVTASAAANAQSVRPAAAESEKTEVAARLDLCRRPYCSYMVRRGGQHQENPP